MLTRKSPPFMIRTAYFNCFEKSSLVSSSSQLSSHRWVFAVSPGTSVFSSCGQSVIDHICDKLALGSIMATRQEKTTPGMNQGEVRTVDGKVLELVVFFQRGRGLLRIFQGSGGVGIGNDDLGSFARTTAGRRRHDVLKLVDGLLGCR